MTLQHHTAASATSAAVHIITMALRIANRAVIEDIETNAPMVDLGDGHRWRDIRPMLDYREHSSECIDMASEAIAYAVACSLVVRHPVHAGHVRILDLQGL